MKAQLRYVQHDNLPGQATVEVLWDGKLVATVTGADGPGVRVISRFNLQVTPLAMGPIYAVEVSVTK